MKYFFDTEFIEGKQPKKLFGITHGYSKPTIDLISIGIVCEDGLEYYAISKDFNLDEAWGRWQPRTGEGDRNNREPREYWLRENVLKPIYEELRNKSLHDNDYIEDHFWSVAHGFTKDHLRDLLDWYGKSNQEIAKEINMFVCSSTLNKHVGKKIHSHLPAIKLSDLKLDEDMVEFYAYYADYDWVVFCQLFGTMMDLPEGFPMYCNDLKQMMDEKACSLDSVGCSILNMNTMISTDIKYNKKSKLNFMKAHVSYPKNLNDHHSLSDARWARNLYDFLLTY